ncbi:MAG TPA: response regulator [Candidatus Pelethocola excrementipullorum]|nr:response regulator [Candidatus Pelethocola excrementipullorum]
MKYSIVLALQDDSDIKKARSIFESEGYQDIIQVHNTLELVLYCSENKVDILVIDTDFPFMDCISTLSYLAEKKLVKVIIAVDENWEKAWLKNNLNCVDIFVTKPLESRKLIPGILVNFSRKEKLEQLEKEYENAEREFRDHKILGYAVHLLMDKMNLTEEEAENYLVEYAKAYDKDLQEVSEIIYSVLCIKTSNAKQ